MNTRAGAVLRASLGTGVVAALLAGCGGSTPASHPASHPSAKHKVAVLPSAVAVCAGRWDRDAVKTLKYMAAGLTHGNSFALAGYEKTNPSLCVITIASNAAKENLAIVPAMQFDQTSGGGFTQGASIANAVGYAWNATVDNNGDVHAGMPKPPSATVITTTQTSSDMTPIAKGGCPVIGVPTAEANVAITDRQASCSQAVAVVLSFVREDANYFTREERNGLAAQETPFKPTAADHWFCAAVLPTIIQCTQQASGGGAAIDADVRYPSHPPAASTGSPTQEATALASKLDSYLKSGVKGKPTSLPITCAIKSTTAVLSVESLFWTSTSACGTVLSLADSVYGAGTWAATTPLYTTQAVCQLGSVATVGSGEMVGQDYDMEVWAVSGTGAATLCSTLKADKTWTGQAG
jgi:hypothetical protein